MTVELPRTLVFSPRANDTSQVLTVAAYRRGMLTEHLTGWRVPEGFTIGGPAHLYAGPLFADAVAADLGVGLLEPPDDWLTRLPYDTVRRNIRMMTMAEAWQLRTPAFLKPPNDKSFPARIYRDGSQLPGPDAVDSDTPVLASDPVQFTTEFRLYALDGEITTGAQYAIDGDLDIEPLAGHELEPQILAFGADVLSECADTLPSAVVVDVGLIVDPAHGAVAPAVIEANAAWASGHYAADPERVLDAVLRAAGPMDEISTRDRIFLRSPVRRIDDEP
ncbi:ATP-grasp domain-containing protein [Catenulispora subtropica]|uniref:ATP-grasp domain-containing protein n=1 Tax=Catenulispora subtropica TaxID=450798 RepID=A0ABN2R4M2_9ACTN